MVKNKPHMITCDVTTLKIFLKHMQPLNDKISGLKVQVKHWQDKCEQLQMELAKVEQDNRELAARLTEVNHENEYLKKEYGAMPNTECGDGLNGGV